MDKQYYDGTKLLSLMDANGKKPEIYICTTNRNAGKTTYFSRLLVNRFIDKKEKFGIIYRYAYELKSAGEKFFSLVQNLFFPAYVMKSEKRDNGTYYELFLNGESCGYALALNKADPLKKVSNVFSTVRRLMFDEFQSETNTYAPDEVKKLLSIHTTIGRGEGEQVRYVPLYMVGNPITILNPYYVRLGISNRLTEQTVFLRGDGFVLEQGFNKSASDAQKQSAFNRAFSADKYVAYSSEGIYLNDNSAFIEKPEGRSLYVCTLKYKGSLYSIREYRDAGIVYCDTSADSSFPVRIAVTTDDHSVNYVMLKQYSPLIEQLRFYFERGCFRFRNLSAKEALLFTLSYK